MIFKKPKNVASVLGAFHKLVDDLEAIATRELTTRTIKGDHVSALLEQMNDHQAEADRANNAATKIKALITA